MENGPKRAEFWKAFILEKSGYPSTSRLREQFEKAKFTGFCDCGCNSFGVKVEHGSARPLLPPSTTGVSGGHACIYEADFRLAGDKTLEIIIFADGNGNIDYIEVDCCANSYPIPAEIEVSDPPFHTRAADGLFI